MVVNSFAVLGSDVPVQMEAGILPVVIHRPMSLPEMWSNLAVAERFSYAGDCQQTDVLALELPQLSGCSISVKLSDSTASNRVEEGRDATGQPWSLDQCSLERPHLILTVFVQDNKQVYTGTTRRSSIDEVLIS